MELIANASLPVSRWHNGAGRKADIAVGDGWLVGFAWLDQDAPFSDLAGYDRTITLMAGPGFTLEIAGRAPLVVAQPFVPAAFDGGAPTQCRIAGPCRVMNVMTARDRARHRLAIVGAGAVTLAADLAAFAVLLRGAATIGGTRPGVLDAVRLDGPAAVEGDQAALVAAISISGA